MIKSQKALEPLKRVAAFEKMGFGMFIHWGLYSQIGKGEWAQKILGIPMTEYKKLMDTFTAESFNANEIAALAKEAGMKYIVLTTRHHDGFSLYDTCGLNKFDAPHSAAKRDLVKEFTEACNKYEIKPFFYHTTLDWHNDDFRKDFKRYQEYLRKSVEILCTNYGKIGGFWFDGNWSLSDADWEEDKLYNLIRKSQPDAIIVNNTGLGARGEAGHIEIDSVTFEQGRPAPMDRSAHKKYLAAEMCETLNNHWGIGSNDLNYKSAPALIENLCACRKVGANYLLNIGPSGSGGISSMDKALLELIGRWVKTFEEAIYETKPCDIIGNNKDFALEKEDGTLYLFIHGLPIKGDYNVTILSRGAGIKPFYNIDKIPLYINWLDNNEELDFVFDEKNKILCINATPFEYGSNYVVRVAKVRCDKRP